MDIRIMGLFAIIPTTILLTISFFVLVVVRKVEIESLKAFGYIITAFLWVSAVLIFSMGVYTLYTGDHPMLSAMRGMSGYRSSHLMGRGQMPGMMGGKMHGMMGGKMHGTLKGKCPMMQEMTQKEMQEPVKQMKGEMKK